MYNDKVKRIGFILKVCPIKQPVKLKIVLYTFFLETGKLFVPFEEECKNEVCHRATFMYGRLWDHDNLNVDTHEIIHELFGMSHSKPGNHIIRYCCLKVLHALQFTA